MKTVMHSILCFTFCIVSAFSASYGDDSVVYGSKYLNGIVSDQYGLENLVS